MTNDEFQKMCSEQFRQIHTTLYELDTSIEKKFGSLDDSIRGKNGCKGINQRLGTLETYAAGRKKFDWMALTAIAGLVFTLCASWILGGIKIG